MHLSYVHSTFDNYDDMEKAYIEGKWHPGDIKAALVIYLNKLIDPVRQHFATNPAAAALLKQVRSFKTSR